MNAFLVFLSNDNEHFKLPHFNSNSYSLGMSYSNEYQHFYAFPSLELAKTYCEHLQHDSLTNVVIECSIDNIVYHSDNIIDCHSISLIKIVE